MVGRNDYVARRTQTRMKSRGEAMVLRRVSLLPGPEPFKSPPDVSNDLTVNKVSVIDGQIYLEIIGSTVSGRLVPNDRLINAGVGLSDPPCLVVTMPMVVVTDADGIPQVDSDGAPVISADPPAFYHADSLAGGNRFPVVPVSFSGDPNMLLGPAHLIFAADVPVYGNPLTFEQMVALGWVEIDTIGFALAARGLEPPPKVNDMIVIFTSEGPELRAIVQIGRKSSNAVNFIFQVQAR
jgi:hypothetical protein